MITNSFVFLEKISNRKEQSLWQQGIKTWDDFLKKEKIKGISSISKQYYNRKIKEAQEALLKNESSFFMGKIPSAEMWRLYDYFKEESCFLDIEVDSYGKITVVGISNYYHTNTWVQGINLNKIEIQKELQKYKLIVTFNGASFDLPKLKKQMGIKITIPHIDLKPLCVKLGLKGGLKEVEKILNLKRPPHLYGNPVELWKAFHASGDREYLELLINYNKEDVENLKLVMDWCYKELRNKIYKAESQP